MSETAKIVKHIEQNLSAEEITELAVNELGQKDLALVDFEQWRIGDGDTFTIDGMMKHLAGKMEGLPKEEIEKIATAVHM